MSEVSVSVETFWFVLSIYIILIEFGASDRHNATEMKIKMQYVDLRCCAMLILYLNALLLC